MKVLIFAKGNAYEKEIAFALQENNIDYTFVTTYPKYFLKKHFINIQNIKSFFILEILKRLLIKLYKFTNFNFLKNDKIDMYINTITDGIFSTCINKDYDLLIVLQSNHWLKSISKAKKLNVKTLYLLAISSSSFKKKTLADECKKLGLNEHYTQDAFVTDQKTEDVIKISDFVGYTSSYQLETFKNSNFNTQNFYYLPQPTNTSVYPIIHKKDPDEKFIVLFVGNDFVRKGAKYLIDAFNNLSLKNAELWMLGIDLQKYASILKLNNKNIKFFGAVKDLDIIDYYKKSSVLCLPSFEEGFPIVIPRAMTFGLPIITTHYGSDFIQNYINGFLVDPGNTNQLEQNIKYLYDNPLELQKMSKNSSNTHNKFFTPKIYVQRLITSIFND